MAGERILDPRAAAAVIREQILHSPGIPPEARHMHAFVIAVCNELGIEPDPLNFMAVSTALHDAGIKPHQSQDYPKMYVIDGKPVRYDNGQCIVFEDADDETEIMAWKTDIQEDGSYVVVEPDGDGDPNVDEAEAARKAEEQRKLDEVKKNDEAKAARRGTAGKQQPDPGVG